MPSNPPKGGEVIKSVYPVGEEPPGALALRREYHEARRAGSPYCPSGVVAGETEPARLVRQAEAKRIADARASQVTAPPQATRGNGIATHASPPGRPINNIPSPFDVSDVSGPVRTTTPVPKAPAHPAARTRVRAARTGGLIGIVTVFAGILFSGATAWAFSSGKNGGEEAKAAMREQATPDNLAKAGVGVFVPGGAAILAAERDQKLAADPNLSKEEKQIERGINATHGALASIPGVGPLLGLAFPSNGAEATRMGEAFNSVHRALP